uniref:Uncharacterized protein n=1 Tax=Candidatus Nitrotoga fabula TaxID=2182327 RepID=A0A2X0RFQ5_9PROT|nr:protein of unknown function [Candidatus Nitrotoga fabula]
MTPGKQLLPAQGVQQAGALLIAAPPMNNPNETWSCLAPASPELRLAGCPMFSSGKQGRPP